MSKARRTSSTPRTPRANARASTPLAEPAKAGSATGAPRAGVHLKSFRDARAQAAGLGLMRRSYDSADTNKQNEKLFADAGEYSIDTYLSSTLTTTRARALYEIRNNSYARGMMTTLADHIVGSGPNLQMLTNDAGFNSEVEDRFAEWCEEADRARQLTFGQHMRLGIFQLCGCGEGLAAFTTDPDLDPGESPVQLRIQSVHPGRLQAPFGANSAVNRMGVEVDAGGKPRAYWVLKRDAYSTLGYAVNEYDVLPARQVLHFYTQDEAGQTRANPWLGPALPILAQMRRFTLATLTAAETAADLAVMLKMVAPEVLETIESFDIDVDWNEVELPRGSGLTLPPGYDAAQMKAEQPAARFAELRHELLNEAARGICMSYNVAAGNSSGYNYSSGRLDKQESHASEATIQNWLGLRFATRTLRAWLSEAVRIPGFLRYGYGRLDLARRPKHQWYWPGLLHVDPQKEATATDIRLKNKTTSLTSEYAREGKDYARELEQIARERQLIKRLEAEYDVDMSDLASAAPPDTDPDAAPDAAPAGADPENPDAE